MNPSHHPGPPPLPPVMPLLPLPWSDPAHCQQGIGTVLTSLVLKVIVCESDIGLCYSEVVMMTSFIPIIGLHFDNK